MPPERCSISWILKRTKREAAIFSVVVARLYGRKAIAVRLVKSVIKLIGGLLLSPPFLLLTRKKNSALLMLIWDAFGGFPGFIGYEAQVYKG